MSTIKIILFLMIALTITNANGQKTNGGEFVVFKGTADQKYNDEYVHIYTTLGERTHDSTQVKNGAFVFKASFKEPTVYFFYSAFERRTKGGYTPFSVLADKPTTITLTADIESFAKTNIKGSDAQAVFDDFSKNNNSERSRLMERMVVKYGKELVYSQNSDTTDQKYKDMIKDYNQENSAYEQSTVKNLAALIYKNPSSFASIVLLLWNARLLDLKQLEKLYSTLSPVYKKGFFKTEIENSINGQKGSAIGKIVTDFTLDDPNGNPLKFSSLKGKYVLIDFWGSWCAPCHVAFKELRKIYAQYHEKGFEILGIATESDKASWIGDIEKEKLPWVQMLDVRGDNNISSKRFAVIKYPTTILVDPNGKILGRDLKVEELHKILSGL